MTGKRSRNRSRNYISKKLSRKMSGGGAEDNEEFITIGKIKLYKGKSQPNSVFDNICLLTDSYKMSHYQQYPVNPNKGTKLQPGQGEGYVYSYFEARHKGEGKDKSDISISPVNNYKNGYDYSVFFGLYYYIKRYLSGVVVTREKVAAAKAVIDKHIGPEQFNEAGWMHIVEKHGGRLPIRIDAVEEGSVIPRGNILFSVVNTDPKCYWLPNLLETLLVQVWYPTTIATQSHFQKNFLIKKFKQSVPQNKHGDVNLHLHDFGFRGVSSVESAGLGGAAHLINFNGTDTLAGITLLKNYYTDIKKGQGPLEGIGGISIPAAEHSTITSWGKNAEGNYDNELAAYQNMLTQYPMGLVAVVTDSYNMYRTCAELWPKLKEDIANRSGKLVIRPDSGEAKDVLPTLMGLIAYNLCMGGDKNIDNMDKRFKLSIYDSNKRSKFEVNKQNFVENVDYKIEKVDLETLFRDKNISDYEERMSYSSSNKNSGLFEMLTLTDKFIKRENKFLLLPTDKIGFIQGDGIDSRTIQEISEAILDKGWSILNCSFGSGGALLQKVNRDTQECAFKCSKFLESKDIPNTTTTVSDSNDVLIKNTDNLIKYISENGEDVAKSPIGEEGKQSKSGVLALVKQNLPSSDGSDGVYSNLSGKPESTKENYTTVDIKKYTKYKPSENILQAIFINGKFIKEDNKFDNIIKNAYPLLGSQERLIKTGQLERLITQGGSRKRYRRHRKRHSRKLKKRHTKKRYPKRRRHQRRSRKHRY